MDNKLNRILEKGRIFAILENPAMPESTLRLYQFKESRGFQTNYRYKPFYFSVTIKNCLPASWSAITKDSRRKEFIARCEKQGTKVIITNAEIFDQWTKN